MAGYLGNELPQELVDFLSGGQCTVVATASNSGQLHTAVMTWVVAKDSRTIRMAMDARGRPLAHIRENPRVAIEILGDELNMAVRGAATVIKERMDAVPFPCALVEIRVEEVMDHAVPEIRFKGPSYRYVTGKEDYYQVERQVFAELKKEV